MISPAATGRVTISLTPATGTALLSDGALAMMAKATGTTNYLGYMNAALQALETVL